MLKVPDLCQAVEATLIQVETFELGKSRKVAFVTEKACGAVKLSSTADVRRPVEEISAATSTSISIVDVPSPKLQHFSFVIWVCKDVWYFPQVALDEHGAGFAVQHACWCRFLRAFRAII